MRILKLLIQGTMATLGKARVPVPPRRPKSSVVRQNKPVTREVRSTASTPTNKKNTPHSKSDSNIAAAFQKLKLHENNQRGVSVSQSRKFSTSSTKKTECETIEDIARVILNKKAKNIVVMAGAGISTPSGIPDFRSPGTGLYDNLQKYRIPYPEAIFDIDYLQRDARPFFTIAKELFPGNYRPNYVHFFVRLLHEKGLLLRMYTQNIDGLERLAGIPASKLVEAHGTFATSSCIRCNLKHNTEDIKDKIFTGKIPRCKSATCTGIVKPDIVFFGEDLPRRFYYYLKDFPQCDLLIVMGTSLEVYPFAGIVDSTRTYIPRLLINRQLVGPFVRKARFNDVSEIGDIVESVKKLARVLGWKKTMEDLIEESEGKTNGESQAESKTGDDVNNGENEHDTKSSENCCHDNQQARGEIQSEIKDNDNPGKSENCKQATKSNDKTTQSKSTLDNNRHGKKPLPRSAPSATSNRSYSTAANKNPTAFRNESIADLKLGKSVYSSSKPAVSRDNLRLPRIPNYQSRNYNRRVVSRQRQISSSSEDSSDETSDSTSDSD
ncbi:NAD-dependent protein deacetylase sirtuin-3-like isoform X2 [Ptychodera flava]|uniref:NAD-dependent protein deacetylase sirtuin-3-like isoform X2 n=1 Tax=Ptychodera flava TaxID=63121 RepID=UPI00396A793B